MFDGACARFATLGRAPCSTAPWQFSQFLTHISSRVSDSNWTCASFLPNLRLTAATSAKASLGSPNAVADLEVFPVVDGAWRISAVAASTIGPWAWFCCPLRRFARRFGRPTPGDAKWFHSCFGSSSAWVTGREQCWAFFRR